MERNDERSEMDRQEVRPEMAPGTSEVHSELTAQPSKGVGDSGAYEGIAAGPMDRVRDRADDAREEIGDRVAAAREEVAERVDDLRGRARDRMDGVRDQASRIRADVTDRAGRALDGTGIPGRVQNHPMLALGAAFGLGYLLAGSGAQKRGMRGKVRTQLRAAIVGGVTAAIAQQAQSILGFESGQGGGLGNLFGSALGDRHSGGTSAAGAGGSEASAYGA
jgi:ElaB/YqjD/DUF883 family membrane-anchored ribosome-binding protein